MSLSAYFLLALSSLFVIVNSIVAVRAFSVFGSILICGG
jgi:hypothetical protein